jgi:hypothetical protein
MHIYGNETQSIECFIKAKTKSTAKLPVWPLHVEEVNVQVKDVVLS